MRHKIARLLGDLEHLAAVEIERLEAALGYPSEDVRLMADNHTAVRRKLAELKLDPDDTTSQELYHALSARYRQDCLGFEQKLGISDVTPLQRAHIAIEMAKLCLSGQSAWALKCSVAKQLLATLPPNRTKKLLGFRSLDSMLKRTHAGLILLLANHVESPSWQKRFHSRLANSDPSNWELKDLNIVKLPKVISQNAVVFEQSAGTIGVGHADLPILSWLAQILQAASLACSSDMTRQLLAIEPALRWWLDNNHRVAWLDKEPVSLNLTDVAINHHSDSFEQRSLIHGGRSLWQKLLSRYEDLPQELADLPKVGPELADTKKFAPELVAVEEISV
ncbi:TPA: hypothetical protein DIS56_00790 [Candidatus Saccharibacteria bacterium]|nr:MAG: hypothetical protein UX30_C0006G0034 [Candidatus Saccharibacteria bacterium GW2011_GWA2_46_10]OGL35025.1 MAG: hypothetical protein A3F05_01690 [Candidatus Saccharibacteria bacterium RIFCSPHIGHO2_12_FULL_47_17]HCM51659.1 hypothetical protein [Candidatus Saccharibacteria bacterium]